MRQQIANEHRSLREEQERKRKREAELADRQRQDEERAMRRREEAMGESEVRASSKLCPGQGCTHQVTKLEGCKHMTCELLFISLFLIHPHFFLAKFLWATVHRFCK